MIRVWYHKNCADGFCSAWIANHYFEGVQSNFPDIGEVEYKAVQYGDDVPEYQPGDKIYILDFSFKRDILKTMSREAEVVVLDHHKTAKDELEGLDFCTFDMDKSGAMLTWEYFNPSEPAPMLVQYVQDRDLWTWELPDSKELNMVIQAAPFDFVAWTHLNAQFDQFRGDAFIQGAAMIRYQGKLVDSLVGNAHRAVFEGHEVKVVNSSLLQSEVGNALAEQDGVDFAIIWFHTGDGMVASLRGNGSVNVSEIAKKHGGGGHPNAAGFKFQEAQPWQVSSASESS